jgi:transposase
MKLVLQDIYRQPSAQTARRRFKVWCRWVKWAARKTRYNLLRPMAKLADTIIKHFEGILAHWKSGLTNAFMEGLNSVLQATKRKARGYKSPEYLTAIIYFIKGGLRIPQF